MSFFRYPGGKTKFKSKIVDALMIRSVERGYQYREPFFGGGGVGLSFLETWTHVKDVWINDRDVGIACLWSSVLAYPQLLVDEIGMFQPHPDKFYSFKEELLALHMMPSEPADIVEVGFKKLVVHQLSFSGLGTKAGGPLGGKSQESKYKIDCRWSPNYLIKKIRRFSDMFSDLNVQYGFCTALDFSVLVQDDTKKAILYLDPPYFNKGSELYQHSFNIADHEYLANILEDCPHDWVLSYDDCPEIRKLYSWASIDQITANYTIRNARVKSELIITPR